MELKEKIWSIIGEYEAHNDLWYLAQFFYKALDILDTIERQPENEELCTKESLESAVVMVDSYAKQMFKNYSTKIDPPTIYPVSIDRGVDVNWKNDNFEMLIYINPKGDKATYHIDSPKKDNKKTSEGDFDPLNFDLMFKMVTNK